MQFCLFSLRPFRGLVLNLYDVEAIVIFRVVCGFIIFWILISLILKMFMDETPPFLLGAKQYDRAWHVLEKIAKWNSTELVRYDLAKMDNSDLNSP